MASLTPTNRMYLKTLIMKYESFFVLGLATLLFTGCSSTPTKVDHGPIKAATFSFVNIAARPQPAYADKRAEAHQLIQEAITTDLAALGVARVASGGDVTVAYLIIVGNNATTSSINDYFGYGRDVGALDDVAHQKYTDNKNPNYFEAGTIVIDIIDSQTNKLLKRNYATRPLLANPTAGARAANIQSAVNEALQGLRIEH
jgi:hypothetical protein